VGEELETRSWPFAAELRQEGEQPVLVGYAVRWGEVSEPLPFRERFLPGAFAKDLASGRDVLALVGHELSKVLARRSNGTLTLREDEWACGWRFAPTWRPALPRTWWPWCDGAT